MVHSLFGAYIKQQLDERNLTQTLYVSGTPKSTITAPHHRKPLTSSYKADNKKRRSTGEIVDYLLLV